MVYLTHTIKNPIMFHPNLKPSLLTAIFQMIFHLSCALHLIKSLEKKNARDVKTATELKRVLELREKEAEHHGRWNTIKMRKN